MFIGLPNYDDSFLGTNVAFGGSGDLTEVSNLLNIMESNAFSFDDLSENEKKDFSSFTKI